MLTIPYTAPPSLELEFDTKFNVMDLAWVITIGVVPSQDDDPLLKQELDE